MSKFPLVSTWGEDRPPLVDFVVLAEFDIDTGSTVRFAYPDNLPKPRDWFAEHMLPEGAHNREMDSTIFFLNRDGPILDEPPVREVEGATAPPPLGPAPFLYCLNQVRTKHDSSVRRGAVVKALAICSRYPFIAALQPHIIMVLDQYYRTPDISVLQSFFEAINSLPFADCPRPNLTEKRLMRRHVVGRAIGDAEHHYQPREWVYATHLLVDGSRMPLSLPLYTQIDEFGEVSPSMFVRVFKEDSMKIYHAILMGQRVLFVGYNHPAGDVCKIVLSAVSLVSPPLDCMIRRTFPYANLTDLTFLEVPGFIAGVTNPMFEAHSEWWDLVCVLDLPNDNGTVTTAQEKLEESKKKDTRPRDDTIVNDDDVPNPHREKDLLFIQQVMSGVSRRYSEDWVRMMFRDYTTTLVEFAIDSERTSAGSGASGLSAIANRLKDSARRTLQANELRIAAIKRLPEYNRTQVNPWSHFAPLRNEGLTIRNHIRLLQLDAHISVEDTERIFADFAMALRSEAHLQVFVSLLPESQGGLTPIAEGLLHASPVVRQHSAALLQKLDKFESTRSAVTALNYFFRMSFNRLIMDDQVQPSKGPPPIPLNRPASKRPGHVHLVGGVNSGSGEVTPPLGGYHSVRRFDSAGSMIGDRKNVHARTASAPDFSDEIHVEDDDVDPDLRGKAKPCLPDEMNI